MSEFITAIDVGTTKVCTFIAELTPESGGHAGERGGYTAGGLRLLGAGQSRSQGLRKGVVVNVPAATQAIAESIEQAEHDAGVTVRSAYVGIVGGHIGSHNGVGAVAIPRGRSITQQDVERALDAARAIPIPSDREVIHTIARNFTVDAQEGVLEPVGMHAYRLEVNAHIITGAATAIHNLVKCIQSNGVTIDELVLAPLASAEAVLTEEERDLGVAVVDVGGGTSDIAVYLGGSVWFTSVVEVGGDNFTRDLAFGLRAPFEAAEGLKIKYGHVLPDWVAADEMINTRSFGDAQTQAIPRRYIAEILEARGEEVFQDILREIKRSGYDGLLPAGMVLTGGTAQMQGLKELGRHQLQLPVRTGMPNSIANAQRQWLTPAHATGLGLLSWAQRHGPTEGYRSSFAFAQRVREWLRNLLPG